MCDPDRPRKATRSMWNSARARGAHSVSVKVSNCCHRRDVVRQVQRGFSLHDWPYVKGRVSIYLLERTLHLWQHSGQITTIQLVREVSHLKRRSYIPGVGTSPLEIWDRARKRAAQRQTKDGSEGCTMHRCRSFTKRGRGRHATSRATPPRRTRDNTEEKPFVHSYITNVPQRTLYFFAASYTINQVLH